MSHLRPTRAQLSNLRVTIRTPNPRDQPAFLSAVQRSARLHRPWVSPPKTPKAFAAYLARASSDSHPGFLIIHRQTRQLVGVINLNNVVRGSFQSACLGYYSFAPFARKGFLSEGMLLVLTQAFCTLRLHRVEANVQPENHSSIALVRKFGFVREGFSRRYLKIGSRWRDHQRWALLKEDFDLKASFQRIHTEEH